MTGNVPTFNTDVFAPGRATGFPGGFTVLMAVYGRDDPPLFGRALESVYNNTLKPDEFVLVVDGPVPETIDQYICRYQSDRGLRALRLPANVGLAAALNRGLKLVQTTWVARADADDLNVSDRFESQAAAVLRSRDSLDLLGGVITEVDKNGYALAVRSVPLTHEQIVKRLRTRSPFNHMTVAYRTARVMEVGGYPDIHPIAGSCTRSCKEDYALWATMIAKGARCANLNQVLVQATTGADLYRRRGGWRYAKAEWDLQRYLLSLGQKSLCSALLSYGLRASVFSLPTTVRGWIYEHLLRERPNGMPSATR
jgi:glycosyltransferase involved in cell wall biosynthesis